VELVALGPPFEAPAAAALLASIFGAVSGLGAVTFAAFLGFAAFAAFFFGFATAFVFTALFALLAAVLAVPLPFAGFFLAADFFFVAMGSS
jgi:hypothetical protein